jgi:hypothetical protein
MNASGSENGLGRGDGGARGDGAGKGKGREGTVMMMGTVRGRTWWATI